LSNTHIFPLDITHFIELTINSIDMLGKAGWVHVGVGEAGLFLKETTRSKLWGTSAIGINQQNVIELFLQT
jgi:hypothetical protein